MRCILAQVVSITTDFGVESKLPVMPDLLPEFFASRGIPVPRNIVRAPKLFPRAVLAPTVWAPLRWSAAESAVQHVVVSVVPDTPQGVADGGPTPQGGYGQLTCG